MINCWARVLLAVLLSFVLSPLYASHIVGGEMTYKCLGPVNATTTQYQVTLDIYQDCLDGDPRAISEDNPAFIAAYSTSGAFIQRNIVPSASGMFVPANFSNNCITKYPPTCLYKLTFITTFDLDNNIPYYIVYQRCCRNFSVMNIQNPGSVGATYFCSIPKRDLSSLCNNSALFKNYPPQIICINNPLIYDHSAIDPDGDSLTYEFCQTYVGGSQGAPKPDPPSPPPFVPAQYSPGFFSTKPMSGNPIIKINPANGTIYGTPNSMGRFVVTVCCNEWRNQKLINTVKREFQFVVTDCSKAVVADIPQYSEEFNTYIVECKKFDVSFKNLSVGGIDYYWDFGVANLQNDTSNLFEPVYTYPDTGTYVVKLIVNRNSTCSDSISRKVKVYPFFLAAFTNDGLPCPGEVIKFFDSSYGSYYPANKWLWDFGDNTSSSEKDPVHLYESGKNYDVSLIAENINGCRDTALKKVFIENFLPFAGNDTVIVKGEHINFNASGGFKYTWSPGTNLSETNISSPRGYYPDTGYFSYSVYILSQYGCEGYDTINVKVVNQSAIFVPSGFSPNGDGRNDVFRPIGIGYSGINYFRVFNRWGEMVFYTTRFDEGWDGRWKGHTQEIGTYFWTLSITNRFGKIEELKGDVLLLH
jgi:gliding motility-associated-like protein